MKISERVDITIAAPKFSDDTKVQAVFEKEFRAGVIQGVLEERRRCVAIMALKEGIGREAMQYQLMHSTKLSPEEVREMLEAVPVMKPKVDNVFAQAMAAIGNPPTSGLDGSVDSFDPAGLEAAAAAAILRSQAQK